MPQALSVSHSLRLPSSLLPASQVLPYIGIIALMENLLKVRTSSHPNCTPLPLILDRQCCSPQCLLSLTPFISFSASSHSHPVPVPPSLNFFLPRPVPPCHSDPHGCLDPLHIQAAAAHQHRRRRRCVSILPSLLLPSLSSLTIFDVTRPEAAPLSLLVSFLSPHNTEDGLHIDRPLSLLVDDSTSSSLPLRSTKKRDWRKNCS